MSVSSSAAVRNLYDETADSYNAMMDQEIELPLYDRVLTDLADVLKTVPGAILDSSCGSGHMLERIASSYCPERDLMGVDLSPEMVRISQRRLGEKAKIFEADMSSLTQVRDSTCAAVISFFALHHVDPDGLGKCLGEWNRVLTTGGYLFLAAWEGSGNVDYGDAADLVARRYTEDEVILAVSQAGFQVVSRSVKFVEEIGMDSVHLIAMIA